MAEKEKNDISSLVSKDITELTASDAREGLDQFLLRSSGDVVDAGIKCKLAGEDEIVGDFAFMISDKVGGILTLLYISLFRCPPWKMYSSYFSEFKSLSNSSGTYKWTVL